MGNEIKVNEYVRTRKGIIGILKQQFIFGHGVNYPEPQEWVIDVNGKKYVTTECDVDFDNIVKHSSNLIDLIQKDDFVNKCRVYEVEEKGITVYQKVKNSAVDYNWITFDEIEEVATKEMMESISYKVTKM